MRKRATYNGLEEIRNIPKACTNCKKPVFKGPVLYEIESNYLICKDCIGNNDGPDGAYIVIEEYDPEAQFKFFRDEVMMNNYEKSNQSTG